MFITVSVGGLFAVAMTAAATGAVTSLYIRAKTVRVIDELRNAMGSVNQSPFFSRWRKDSMHASEKPRGK